MELTKPSGTTDATNVLGASATAGGIGTIIALSAENLVSPTWRPVLTQSAPLVTAGISGLWLFLKIVYIDPYVARKQKAEQAESERTKDAEAMERIETWYSMAKQLLEKVLNDPQASKTHKDGVRKTLEELERLRLEKIAERIRSIS